MLDQSLNEVETNTPEFTGVWIPADVFQDEALAPLDLIIYAHIASFRTCFASNAWLAKRVHKSEDTISRSISKLTKAGYIELIHFDGKRRELRACLRKSAEPTQKCRSSLRKSAEAASAKMPRREQSVEQRLESSSKEEGSEAPSDGQESKPKEYRNALTATCAKTEQVPKEYGNADVNALIRLFEAETGIKADPSQLNRRAAYSLIRSRGKDGAERLTKLAGDAIRSADQYAPRIGSFKDLVGKYEKASKLEAWATKQKAMRPKTIANFYAQSAPEPAEGGWEPIDKQTLAELRKRALGGLK